MLKYICCHTKTHNQTADNPQFGAMNMNYRIAVLPVLLLAFCNNIFSYIRHFTNSDKKFFLKCKSKLCIQSLFFICTKSFNKFVTFFCSSHIFHFHLPDAPSTAKLGYKTINTFFSDKSKHPTQMGRKT
jgi:hypothetical protein